jgi:predicted enzyme related to lactoylglutathione lyase
VEWSTHDPKRLKKFYGRIFDWTFDEPMPGYTIMPNVGGIFAIPPGQEMPTGITNYVNVDDLGKKEKLVTKAGGTIYKSKQEVPGMGWFTIFGDPDGNTVAMWQPAPRPPKAAARKAASSKKPAASKKSAAKKSSKR